MPHDDLIPETTKNIPRSKSPLRPPLKWAGGKRWLTPRLIELYCNHNGTARLVEPFVGGMSVALALGPKYALLNDINPHLIFFYQCLQEGLKFNDYGFSMDKGAENYYRNRRQFNELVKSKKFDRNVARLFYYLNRTGYNGLCRYNLKGEFNTPHGKYKTVNYATNEELEPYTKVMRNWEFCSTDFSNLVTRSQDFLYADPPYDSKGGQAFTSYNGSKFTWTDQVRLATWLSNQECTVVASNLATSRILKLYQCYGFTTELIEAPRRISCNGDRTPVMEMLAIKE